jgi:hypothetical protein
MKLKLDLSICILSWKGVALLEKTLETYLENKLLDFSSDINIFFQEINISDLECAKKFNINFIGNHNNIGISKAFLRLVENAQSSNILFLEHDWNLIENAHNTYLRLEQGINLLNIHNVNVVRFRHRLDPGKPHYSFGWKGKELDYFDEVIGYSSPHLIDSVHWLDPSVYFPDKFVIKHDHFITTSRYGGWTNNPCMFKKDFLLKILPNFLGTGINLERDISRWWAEQNFIVAQGTGLFKHNDFLKYSNIPDLPSIKL